MINVYDNDVEVFEYDIDYTNFNLILKHFFYAIRSHESAWVRQLPYEEFEGYLHLAFQMYAVRNLAEYRPYTNKDPLNTVELDTQSQVISVPRYFRGIFREMVRPMEFNGNVYIPNVDYNSNRAFHDQLERPLTVSAASRVIHALREISHKSSMVTLDVEQTKPICLSFHTPNGDRLYTKDRLPAWREKAVMTLRHVRFSEVPAMEASPSGDTLLGTLVDAVVNGSSLQGRLNGRKVNGINFFVLDSIRYNPPPTLRLADIRFVDSDDPSRTPPRNSKRLTETKD